ncbi:hypothetical protein PVAND_001752 [Polypedilum vanderplanki]|uniref:Uncharacterized protein n=1 Tax=Polypedilum vanderplanki TaxID=319348 RepID=A0A9J6BPB2_POLVA|nr:hypothetical protein PVAND_001752 [Polypedilum vanderplanki]
MCYCFDRSLILCTTYCVFTCLLVSESCQSCRCSCCQKRSQSRENDMKTNIEYSLNSTNKEVVIKQPKYNGKLPSLNQPPSYERAVENIYIPTLEVPTD